MEYVAHHTPGGGRVTGDISKSLGDGVGPGLGNRFPLLALRESWLCLWRRAFGGSDNREYDSYFVYRRGPRQTATENRRDVQVVESAS